MRKLIHAVSKKDDKFRAKVRLVHHADSMEVDAGLPHIKILQKNAKQAAGRGRIVGAPYWTDGADTSQPWEDPELPLRTWRHQSRTQQDGERENQ